MRDRHLCVHEHLETKIYHSSTLLISRHCWHNVVFASARRPNNAPHTLRYITRQEY
jgi:hypothetical protein